MELRDYLRVLRRRWKSMLLIFVVAVGAATAVTVQTTPQYAAKASLFITTNAATTGEAYTGGLFSGQRTASYATLATGQELAQRVVERRGLTLTAEELAQKIDATPSPDTVLLSVSVQDADPGVSRDLTQAVAEELVLFVAELETPPGATVPIVKATIWDPARLPASPISPNPVRNLGLGAVLGFLLGFAVSVLREVLDTSVKGQEEASLHAGGPVLGSVNFDGGITKKPLISEVDSHSPRIEAFRVLRTNLQFIDIDADGKVIVVTSSVPGEGKSTTTVNLAITLAQAGQRVLLVDGDLRRPQIARMLGLEQEVGLTTVLVGQIGIEDAIQHHSASGVSALTSGKIPPNPSELLQSRAMKDFLAGVRGSYDIVLIDSPPLLPVTDSALLASQADGAIVVVRHGKTTRDQLQGSRERLDAVEGRLLGLVMNMVPSGSSRYGYGYGYGYAPANVDGKKKAERQHAVKK